MHRQRALQVKCTGRCAPGTAGAVHRCGLRSGVHPYPLHMVGALGPAVCAVYMNCTVPTGDCTFTFGRLGADGLLAPLSALPRLNAHTNTLHAGLKASSGSTLYLPSASSNGTGCCNPTMLTRIDLASGSEQQTALLQPPELKHQCGKFGCGLFQIAFDPTNNKFPIVAWLQPNSAPPPPGITKPTRVARTETDPIVRLDPVTGLLDLVRHITTIASTQAIPTTT